MGHGDQNLNLPGNLNFSPDPARVQELMGFMPAEPFHLGRPAADRAAWERIKATAAGQRLLEEARAIARQPVPDCVSNAGILQVIQTGERVAFADAMGIIRNRQVILPLAECLASAGEHLPAIEEDIRLVCDLKMWTFPTPEYGRDYFEGKNVFIDLTALHFAGNLATTLHLLGDRLRPATRERIRREIETRIFQPFEARIKTGRDMFWWFTVTHNWNSVCLATILDCALGLKASAEERAWYVAVTEKLIRHSEEGFESSGFYTEGVGYWEYGFSHYVLAAELVRGATGGKTDWLQKPRAKAVSHFGHRMEIQQGAYPSFADCKRDVRPAQWLMHWLNNRLDPARTTRRTARASAPFDPTHLQFAGLIQLLLFHQVDLNQAYAHDEGLGVREWFDDVQFLISRPGPAASTRLAATFKGGHNGVNHNHNDLGTFTVLSGREELLVDPGSELYTARTFGPHRYEGSLLNSYGHPVPVVAGELQFPDKTYHRTGYGRDAYALVVDTSFTAGHDRVIIELDRAYKVRHLQNLIRAFTYDRTGRGAIEVWDQVVFEHPDTFETALLTYADWQRDAGGRLRISANGEAIHVEVSSPQGELEFRHEVIRESATPTRFSWRFPAPVAAAAVRIRVTPA